jgi:hypothetical protein
MSKKKPAHACGQAVQGEILPTIVIDCSAWIDNPEEWTRGPVLPVGAAEQPASKKRSEAKSGKKRVR